MLSVKPQKLDPHLPSSTLGPENSENLTKNNENSTKKSKPKQSAAAEIIQDINKRAIINGEVKFQEGCLETFGYDSLEEDKEELEAVDVLNFPKIKLITLKCLPNFKNLTILRLPNNFLSKINEIQYLENLIWLDLHSNQIQSFPRNRYFWRNLQNLLVLNLHENLFESYLDIQSVSAIKNLTALTVFNTPMSVDNAIQINIKNNKNVVNYRHQLVNSCFNLKALDHHIVSDEEIIEHLVIDSKFSKFKTLSENLRISLCSKCEVIEDANDQNLRDKIENQTYSDLQKILDEIDLKIKHVSPVQIIQRWTRGFLARKRLGKVLYKKEQMVQQREIMNVKASTTSCQKIAEPSVIPTKQTDLTLDDLLDGPQTENNLFDLSNLEFNDIVPELPKNIPNKPKKITILKSIPSKEYFDVSHSYLTNSAPFTSRAPSAKTRGEGYNHYYGDFGQKNKADLDWFIHLLEKLQCEIEHSEKFQRIVPKSSLVKPKDKSYDSFPLRSQEETQKWIDDRNISPYYDLDQKYEEEQPDSSKNLHFFRNQSLEIVGKISKFFNAKGDSSEEHTEREDLLHLAKIHRQQMAHLDEYVREQREEYIKERKEKCQTQKTNEAIFHKNKDIAIKENMAMLSAIKPILRIARERQNEAKMQALQNKKEVIDFTRFKEAKNIEDQNTIRSAKAQQAKETEKFEQALISLALNDNQRRDKLYTEFARKRALIWRMKAKAAKDTIKAGRKFAAETASLSRTLTKENFDCMKEKKCAEKNNFVKVHREDRNKRQEKIKIFKENSKLVRQINDVNDQIRGLNQTGIEKEKIYKLQRDRRQSRLDQLHADFVMEPSNDVGFLSPRVHGNNRRGSMFFVGQWMDDQDHHAMASAAKRPQSVEVEQI